jgi:DNA-binding MarR family transcriptional regulator
MTSTERPVQDSVDRHVARWADVLGDLDAEVEGAVTRMQAITKRLRSDTHARYSGTEDTLEDYTTLHALMVQPQPGEATPARLAEGCGVTRAAMTSRLDRLVERGHVTRETDPLDRRRTIVRPTASGRTLWQEGLEEGMAREKSALAALTPAELHQLNGLLRRVLLHLEESG